MHFAILDVSNTDGLLPLEQNARGKRFRFDAKVLAASCGRQEDCSRRAPPAPVGRHRIVADTQLRAVVWIVVQGQTQIDAGCEIRLTAFVSIAPCTADV